MTEQTEHFDDIDKLHAQLDAIQTRHGQALRDLQANEGKLLDKNLYNQRRAQISSLHEEASKAIISAIAEETEAQRKNLALSLRYEGNTEVDRTAWAHAVEMVEGAKTIPQQEELIHRALRWGDKALARALVMRLGGVPEYKAMHEVLAGVDERVRAVWEFERKHGAYAKKSQTGGTWAGWQSYRPGEIPDIPGRDPSKQPAFLREQKRLQWEQRRAGK